jgi:CMP-N-acetylneuraminic acid synthetase
MILGIIPARGGSKGIPRKNIKEIAGKPLIAWTIETARDSKLIDKFVVSTEDREIAKIAREYGADVLERPKELAGDLVPTIDVLKHAVKEIDADIVVVLQPTSPIRDKNLIDDCIRRFIEKGADSLATGFVCKYVEYGRSNLRRQDIGGFFYDDGGVYVIKADLIKKGDRYGKKTERFITDKEQNIDIDDKFDFWMAEQVLKKRLMEGKQRKRV